MIRAVALVSILTVSALALPHPKELRGAVPQKRQALKETVGTLEGVVNDVQAHSADAAKIKHAIAQKQSQLRVAKHKHNVLTDNEEQLEKAHAHLIKSLHKDHDPKVQKARSHFEKVQEGYLDKVDNKQHWESELRKDKAEDEQVVKEEREADHALTELQSELELEKKEEEKAETKFRYSKQMAKEETQSLAFSDERYKSELSRLKKAQDKEREVEVSVGAESDAKIRDMQEVEDAKRDVRAEQDDVDDWKANLDTVNEKVAEMTKENATAYKNLMESQAKLKQTQLQAKSAKSELKGKQEKAAKAYDLVKTAEAKVEEFSAKLKLAKAGAAAALDAQKRLDTIRAKEEQKIEADSAHGKEKLEHKIKDMDASRDHTATDIANLNSQYADWQKNQLERVQKVKAVKEKVQSASKDYTESLKDARARLPKKAPKPASSLLRKASGVRPGGTHRRDRWHQPHHIEGRDRHHKGHEGRKGHKGHKVHRAGHRR